MRDLLILLISLKQLIKQYHWFANGYASHIFADRLEEGLESEIDELAELILAVDESANLNADYLLREAAQKVIASGQRPDTKVLLQNIANTCGTILELAKNNKVTNPMVELAFNDYLGRLSNSLVRKLYLIQLQFNKE